MRKNPTTLTPKTAVLSTDSETNEDFTTEELSRLQASITASAFSDVVTPADFTQYCLCGAANAFPAECRVPDELCDGTIADLSGICSSNPRYTTLADQN